MPDFAFVVGGSGDWTARAACTEPDADLFFSNKPAEIAKAKGICEGCEVRVLCLLGALERDEEFGIWGGLTPEERESGRREILRHTA